MHGVAYTKIKIEAMIAPRSLTDVAVPLVLPIPTLLETLLVVEIGSGRAVARDVSPNRDSASFVVLVGTSSSCRMGALTASSPQLL